MNKKQKPLKSILIGCGAVGKKHLDAIKYYAKRGEVELSGIADPNIDRASALASKVGFDLSKVKIIGDYQALIEAIKPDIVAVATPPASHFDIAAFAIKAGAHVILEKPMTLNLGLAKQLKDLSRAHSRHIVLGHIYRYLPVVAHLQEALALGHYGKILYGSIELAWGHDQAYYDAAAWRGTFAQEGGVLMNQGIHALDLMSWFIGSNAKSAVCRMARQTHQMEAEDLALGVLQFDNGAYCTIAATTSTAEQPKLASFQLYTEKAIITAGVEVGKHKKLVLKIDQSGKKTGKWKLLLPELVNHCRRNGVMSIKAFFTPHTVLWGDLIVAIWQGNGVKADAASGVQSVAACLALYEAAYSGNLVEIADVHVSLADLATTRWQEDC